MIPLDPAILEYDYEWKQGSRERAYIVARDFVNLYRDELERIYSKYTLEELVEEVKALRAKGGARYHDKLVTDMWLLSEFPPQNIVGEAHVIVDILDVLSQAVGRKK